jgi:DNA polymerase
VLRGEAMPAELHAAILNPDTIFIAHNADFEHAVLTVVGQRMKLFDEDVWYELRRPERWSCTANRAAAFGMPRALEKVALALHLHNQKDVAEGKAIMLSMCKPCGFDAQGKPLWIENDIAVQKLIAYCIADVEAEREADLILPDLSPFEREVAAATTEMNIDGIAVDENLLQKMSLLARSVQDNLNLRILRKSNGQVPRVTNPQAILRWMKQAHDLDVDSLGKWILNDLVEDEGIDPLVREVLVLRRDGGKSSVAKLSAIGNRTNSDQRLRGAIVYCGAPSTSRFASRGAQLQNLPRGRTLKDPLGAVRAVQSGLMTGDIIEKTFGPPMVVFSELIRPLFIADSHTWLARGDYSQIEARVCAWLADHGRRLQMFRDYDAGTGPDVYITTAADILEKDYENVSKDDRQLGKAIELASGYLGSVGAFETAAKLYPQAKAIPVEHRKIIIDKWRETNSAIVDLGRDLLRGAFNCMRASPGKYIPVRSGIAFMRTDMVLQLQKPSGTCITYWYPRLEPKPMPWVDEQTGEPAIQDVITYMKHPELSDTDDHRDQIWRGLLIAELTQSTARDIMCFAMVNLRRRGDRPCMTVHDELICKLDMDRFPTKELAASEMTEVMTQLPDWAWGLPVAVDASADTRYIKS